MSVAKIWTFGGVDRFFQMLAQQDRDRIGLLAGGATGDPDAHLIVAAFILEQLRNDRCLERLKGRGITKEISHTDQQIAKQRAYLLRLALQPLCVILELCSLHHLHSALDAALKGSFLVFTKVVPGARAQQIVRSWSARHLAVRYRTLPNRVHSR